MYLIITAIVSIERQQEYNNCNPDMFNSFFVLLSKLLVILTEVTAKHPLFIRNGTTYMKVVRL